MFHNILNVCLFDNLSNWSVKVRGGFLAHQYYLTFLLTMALMVGVAPQPLRSSGEIFQLARRSCPVPILAQPAPKGRLHHPERRWAHRSPLPRNQTGQHSEDRCAHTNVHWGLALLKQYGALIIMQFVMLSVWPDWRRVWLLFLLCSLQGQNGLKGKENKAHVNFSSQ